MSVAVRESVVNAIKHGNGMDESKRVALEFTLHPSALEVEVADQGEGFDPERGPRSRGPGEPAEGRRPRHLLHEVVHGQRRYSFPKGGGTVVRMIKKLA